MQGMEIPIEEKKMKYDFDRVIDRRNTNSYKWDSEKDVLPLWVADMDFETAPCVKEAIVKKAQFGIFGYSIYGEEWEQSYISWWKRRHNFEIKREWLIFTTGIIPAISTCVRKHTTAAEKVLVQTPCYNIFFNSIVNNGRVPLESPLAFDGTNYSIDFDRLEKDLSDPQCSLMILCNPQNPTGTIWKKDELARIGELCKKHGVKVISDEIHCDVTVPGKSYIPFAAASDVCASISVSCISPTKCFNIAGINTAAVVVPDEFLRHKVWRGLNTDEVAEPNVFAIDATVAAFNDGEDWLNQLNEYIFENRKFAADYIAQNCKGLSVINSEATYLLWVKLPDGIDGNVFAQRLKEKTGLFIIGGNEYGKTGENFVRINLACPRSILEDAMERLKKFKLTL